MNFKQITIEELDKKDKPYVVYLELCSLKALELLLITERTKAFASYNTRSPIDPAAWKGFCIVANVTPIRTYWSIEPISHIYSIYKNRSEDIVPCYINENPVNFSLLRKEISNIKWSEVPEWELYNLYNQIPKVANVNTTSSNSKE